MILLKIQISYKKKILFLNRFFFNYAEMVRPKHKLFIDTITHQHATKPEYFGPFQFMFFKIIDKF